MPKEVITWFLDGIAVVYYLSRSNLLNQAIDIDKTFKESDEISNDNAHGLLKSSNQVGDLARTKAAAGQIIVDQDEGNDTNPKNDSNELY